ncbi:MAG: serine hydrolase [Proteobacteria bacterium]|nr:serine hydrolase [Pseudomonadota bacterium]
MTTLMTGFPPAPHDQVTLANWRTAPFNCWAFQHVRELVPSAEIAHDPAAVRALPAAPIDAGGVLIRPAGARDLSLDGFLEAAGTDGLVVLHRGGVVIERYAHGMTAATPHILMSVSKSLTGLLTGVLIGRGDLDADRPVTAVLPEIAGTAYDGATIRQLLDMRTGVAFAEDYTATSGPIVEYRKSTNWNPLAPGERPSDLRGFYRSLTALESPHGGRFHYISPNTDLLGWVIERATGRRFADLMSALIWRPIGAEHSAYVTVDRLGAPRCAGGICATVRDLARVGQAIVDGAVVPGAWIDDIATNGSPEAWNAGVFAPFFPGRVMHYRAKWYVERGDAPLLFGLGIHGQYLFVDRRNQIVIATVSSQVDALDAGLIALTMAAVAAIRRALAGA